MTSKIVCNRRKDQIMDVVDTINLFLKLMTLTGLMAGLLFIGNQLLIQKLEQPNCNKR